MRCRSSGGKPTKPISTDSMPMLRSTNLPAMTSPTRALMISPLPENVAIGFGALPNVPMYLYVERRRLRLGRRRRRRHDHRRRLADVADAVAIQSVWSGFALSGQLSRKSGTPSLSLSGGGGGGGGAVEGEAARGTRTDCARSCSCRSARRAIRGESARLPRSAWPGFSAVFAGGGGRRVLRPHASPAPRTCRSRRRRGSRWPRLSRFSSSSSPSQLLIRGVRAVLRRCGVAEQSLQDEVQGQVPDRRWS